MISRRNFFGSLAAGLAATNSAGLFLPKLLKPAWKPDRLAPFSPAALVQNIGEPYQCFVVPDTLRDEFGSVVTQILFPNRVTADFYAGHPPCKVGDLVVMGGQLAGPVLVTSVVSSSQYSHRIRGIFLDEIAAG